MKKKALCILLNICFCFWMHPEDRNVNDILSSPERKLSSYHFNPESKIISRVMEPQTFIMNYLKKMDNRTDYEKYKPDYFELKKIEKNLRLMPDSFREILQNKIAGIYFVKNLLGSGLTDWVLDENRNIYLIMVFNSDVLSRSISDWLTYKENSCFIYNADEFRIKMDCGNQVDGFLYILLHELSHSYDYINRVTPAVDPELSGILNAERAQTEFVAGIWKDYAAPETDKDFESRKNITFYKMNQGPKISIADAMSIYQQLQETPFVSLYGCISWAEDFAELSAFYYLTEKLNQKFTIEVLMGNKIIYASEPMKKIPVKKRFEIIRKYVN